ncbi:hypothetical protein TNCV_4212081 [Trichonephila clavipes]|nr:hypothetical protein TNCV_4212081 [Trichonephila clavipes]
MTKHRNFYGFLEVRCLRALQDILSVERQAQQGKRVDGKKSSVKQTDVHYSELIAKKRTSANVTIEFNQQPDYPESTIS